MIRQLIIISILTFCFSKCNRVTPYVEAMSFDNLIILDSINLTEGSFYWFCKNDGISGYSTGFIAFSKSIETISENNLILASSYITHMGYNISRNTLEVTYFENEYGLPNDLNIIQKDNHAFKLEHIYGGDPLKSMNFRLMDMDTIDRDLSMPI